MKTNKEKYPNTDDALAAWRKHREECKCDCTFHSWLNDPCDEEIEKAAKDLPRGLGVALAGLLAGSLVADAINGHFKDEKPKDGDRDSVDGGRSEDLECPLCHKKHGAVKRDLFISKFKCSDCGACICFPGENPDEALRDNAELRRRIVAATA